MLLALPSLANAHPGTGPELVQRSGRLVVVHADRYDGTATRQWTLVDGSRHLRVRTPDDVWIDPGAKVRLEGTMQDGTLVLANSASAVTQLAAAPALAATTSAAPLVHNTAVILAQWSGNLATTTPGVAASTMSGSPDSLNAYYLEQTYGQLDFHASVFGPVQLSGTSSCPGGFDNALYDWLEEAESMVPGFSEAPYQHIVLAFPTATGCSGLSGVAGVAEIGQKHVWINGDFSVRVLAHELGHNLGLAHAGGLACTSGGASVTIGATCPVPMQYGDPFDAMGRASTVRQMSMQHKLALHLLPSSAVKVVGAAATYRIAPMETLSGAVELLRIPKPGGGNYYVEYRYPIGFFDSQAPLLQGVLIRTEAPPLSDANDPDTSLIDMHPATASNWNDAAMDVSQTFSDPLSGITIQNVAQDPTGVTLQIAAPRDAVPPSAATGLTAVASATSAVLHWDPASDDYQVDSYVVTRDGAQAGTPTGTDFTDTNLVPGTIVAYAVSAVDAGGNIGPAVAVNVAIPDTTPPTAPAKVTAKLSKDGKVSLTWAAASDNGRVAGYRVLRAGKPIASGNDFAYVDKAPKPGTGSTVTYSVVAVDLAGNVGPAAKATPLRAALMRKLAGSALKATRVTVGLRTLVRVKGKVSDAQARCRLRVGKGTWHACKAKPNGAFAVNLPPQGTTPVTLSLRDALGRVKLQTIRVR